MTVPSQQKLMVIVHCLLALAYASYSIVQRSITGPCAVIAYVSDCKTLGSVNFILKYADDFNLLIPENSDVSAEDEMKHIMIRCCAAVGCSSGFLPVCFYRCFIWL